MGKEKRKNLFLKTKVLNLYAIVLFVFCMPSLSCKHLYLFIAKICVFIVYQTGGESIGQNKYFSIKFHISRT